MTEFLFIRFFETISNIDIILIGNDVVK